MSPFERALGLACGQSDREMMDEEGHRLAQRSVQLQALQTGLLAHMSASMASIHAEVAQARAAQAESLALQQELLARERLQDELEEFVYQMEKLVAACRDTTTDMPPSTRYFLLTGVVTQIEQDGIATAVIRGRENKAAFERAVRQVRALRTALEGDPEVREAVAWANKMEGERARRRRQIEKRMAPLRTSLEALRGRRNSATLRGVAESWLQKGKSHIPQPFWAVFLVCYGCALIFVFPVMVPATLLGLWFGREPLNRELNAKIDEEIETVEERLGALKAEMDAT